MNILFVNTIQMFGGGEVWMLRTLKELQKRGHNVALLCRPHTKVSRRASEKGIKVFTIKFGGDLEPRAILKTYRIIKKENFQIILANMDKGLRVAGLAAKIAGNCCVIPRRGIDFPLKNKIHYRLSYNWLADVIIANSKATKNSLLKNAPWLNPEKICVIYNGINPSAFSSPANEDLKTKWGIPSHHAVLGFVGQLDERKGIDTLMSAFASAAEKNQNLHLVLAGEGPKQVFIQEFALKRHLSNRVHLLGFQENVEELMKAIDILILPSLWEGFGIVLIEAMAAGKPAITTNVSSMPEIVANDITGKVVPVEDQESLANAIYELSSDPNKVLEMGRKGRQRVLDMFTIEHMVDELEHVFETCLKTKLTKGDIS